ncbi:MAG: hypothetical protein AAF527_04255 [Pseudomonadota bacterium]
MSRLWRSDERIETPCTIEIEHSHDHLHAHVSLENGIEIDAGDRVIVHGEPVRIKFGEKQTLHRQATVTRASSLRRFFVKLAAQMELTELFEVSFTGQRII